MAYTVSEINGDFGRNGDFSTLAYLTPQPGRSPWTFVMAVALKNCGHTPTRWWKEFDDMWIRLNTIPQRDERTDGQTEVV